MTAPSIYSLTELSHNSEEHFSSFDQLIKENVSLIFNKVFLYSKFRVLAYEFVVKVDGEEAGWLTVTTNQDFTVNPFDGNIGLFLKPNYRDHGLSKLVLTALVPLFEFHGLDQILITYDEGNDAIEKTCLAFGGKHFDTVQSPKVRYVLNFKP